MATTTTATTRIPKNWCVLGPDGVILARYMLHKDAARDARRRNASFPNFARVEYRLHHR